MPDQNEPSSELFKLSKCARSLIVAVKALERIKARSSHLNQITAAQTAADALDEISAIHGWTTWGGGEAGQENDVQSENLGQAQ